MNATVRQAHMTSEMTQQRIRRVAQKLVGELVRFEINLIVDISRPAGVILDVTDTHITYQRARSCDTATVEIAFVRELVVQHVDTDILNDAAHAGAAQ